MELLGHFSAAFEIEAILWLLSGILLGLPVGAIPGLTSTMTLAILLPVTFFLDPLHGVMMLLGIYMSVMYSQSIPAILINTPGTPAAVSNVIDGYPMMTRGFGGIALSATAIASGIGGVIGGVLLTFAAPAISSVTRYIDSPVYFMLAIGGLLLVVAISERNLVKGLISAVIGILISFVGLDPIAGVPRFTFGSSELASGLNLVPLLIGLFGLSEALKNFENIRSRSSIGYKMGRFRLTGREVRKSLPSTLGGSFVGFGVGVLPGVGADIAGFVAHSQTKRLAKDKSQFGKGDIRGVTSTNAATNSAAAGALVPTMTLGIPGDTVTAILIGAITVHGLRPGPQLFESEPQLVYGVFAAVIMGAIMIMLLGLAGVRLWASLVKIPASLFWPIILLLCTLGSFALRGSFTDIFVMLLAGLVGYVMTKANFPLAPLVIGLILGPMIEENYGRAMAVTGGTHEWLLEPIPFVMLAAIVISVGLMLVNALRNGRNTSPASKLQERVTDDLPV